MKSNICTSILALFCAATTAQASLALVNGGFETNLLDTDVNVLSNFASKAGTWGVEGATITLATAGVTPFDPTHMLSMTGSGSFYQAYQVTQVSPSDIGSIVNLSAFFNTQKGVSSASTGVIVKFFNGTDYNSDEIPGTQISNSLILDGSEFTWEKNSVSGVIPLTTSWIVSQVLYNAASLGANPGFVDAASLTIEPVPEPGTALFGIACVGVAALRRRRNSAV